MIEPPAWVPRALFTQSGEDKQVAVNDVIRLLMRCLQLYEAKQLALTIHRSVTEMKLIGGRDQPV